MEGIAKINFSPKSFYLNSDVEFCGFLGGLGNRFSGFLCIENNIKNMWTFSRVQ